MPVQLRRPPARFGQHRRVNVDADDAIAQFGQPERDPSGATPRVEHRPARPHQRGDQPRLPVHVDTPGSQSVEMRRVRRAGLARGQPRIARPQHRIDPAAWRPQPAPQHPRPVTRSTRRPARITGSGSQPPAADPCHLQTPRQYPGLSLVLDVPPSTPRRPGRSSTRVGSPQPPSAAHPEPARRTQNQARRWRRTRPPAPDRGVRRANLRVIRQLGDGSPATLSGGAEGSGPRIPTIVVSSSQTTGGLPSNLSTIEARSAVARSWAASRSSLLR